MITQWYLLHMTVPYPQILANPVNSISSLRRSSHSLQFDYHAFLLLHSGCIFTWTFKNSIKGLALFTMNTSWYAPEHCD